MKKVLATVAVIGLMAAASAAFGQGIASSKHNLTSTGPGTVVGTATDNSQICIYCHAPHNANISLPLWNRSNPTASTFILYSGINMASRQFRAGFSANSTSLFCMSCHDGSTAMDAVFNSGSLVRNVGMGEAGSAGLPLLTGSFSGDAAFGTDLSKTHPINFPVPTVDNQNDLWVGAGTSMGGNSPYAVAFPLFETGDVRDGGAASSRALECGSCHAVHDSTVSPFLRYTMAGSALCLGCHNK